MLPSTCLWIFRPNLDFVFTDRRSITQNDACTALHWVGRHVLESVLGIRLSMQEEAQVRMQAKARAQGKVQTIAHVMKHVKVH